MTLNPRLMTMLACPSDDHAPLREEFHGGVDTLVCSFCATRFPVLDGIPVLLLDDASPGPRGVGVAAEAAPPVVPDTVVVAPEPVPEQVAVVAAEPVAFEPEPEPEPVAFVPEPEPVAFVPEPFVPEPAAFVPEPFVPEPEQFVPVPEQLVPVPEPEPVTEAPVFSDSSLTVEAFAVRVPFDARTSPKHALPDPGGDEVSPQAETDLPESDLPFAEPEPEPEPESLSLPEPAPEPEPAPTVYAAPPPTRPMTPPPGARSRTAGLRDRVQQRLAELEATRGPRGKRRGGPGT